MSWTPEWPEWPAPNPEALAIIEAKTAKQNELLNTLGNVFGNDPNLASFTNPANGLVYTQLKKADGSFNGYSEVDPRTGRENRYDVNGNQNYSADPKLSFSDLAKPVVALAASFLAPGAGTALGTAMGLPGIAATIVGQAAINTALNGGDVESAIISAAIPLVGRELAGAASSAFVNAGMDKALADSVGKVVSGAGLSYAQGKDPLDALINGGLSAGTSAITQEIPIFKDLPEAGQRAVRAAIAAELTGKDPTQAVINSAISSAMNASRKEFAELAVQNSSAPTLDTLGDMPSNQALLDAIGYTPEAPAAADSIAPTNDELGYTPSNQEILDAIGYTPETLSVAESVAPTLDTLGDTPTNQGILDAIGYTPEAPAVEAPVANDVPEMVITAPRPSPSIEDSLAPTLDGLGYTPTNQEILDAIGYTPEPVEDNVPEMIITAPRPVPSIYDSLAPTPDELGDSPSNQEILDAIGYTPEAPTGEITQDQMTPEDWAALYAQPTTDPVTGETIVGGNPADYPNQDFGVDVTVPDDFTGEAPELWRPNEDGTQTLTSDDGSTLTIDSDGNIVGSTDAPAGNLPGETPPVPPTGGATGTGGAPAGGTGGAPGTPKAPAAGGVDLASLFGLMGMMGSGQSAAPMPMAENSADIQLMSDIFGPTLTVNPANSKRANRQTATAAQGGSVDELLRLLGV